MAYEILLGLHGVAILLFGGYILLDRLLFRPFLAETAQNAGIFYRMSRRVLIPIVSVLVVSGLLMVVLESGRITEPLFILKLILALLLIALFFYCPRFSREHGEGARRLYRAVVVILLLTVLTVSKFFI